MTKRGLVAEKGRFSRLLPFLFHVSILVIIIGALIGAIFGFVGTVNVHVDTETDQYFNWTELKPDKLDFVVRVDKFYLKYYPETVTVAVKDLRYPGKVDLYDVKEREPFKIKESPYTVIITDPMLDKRFTQSNFFYRIIEGNKVIGEFYDNQEIPDLPYKLYYPVQLRVSVRPRGSSVEISKHELAEGGAFFISGTSYRVVVNAVVMLENAKYPNFHLTLFDGSKVIGEYYNNRILPSFPYDLVLEEIKTPKRLKRIPEVMKAKLQIKKDGIIKAEGDVEVNHPMKYEDITFFETSYDRDSFGFMYVGFQIVKDPGVTVVYFGFILMLISVIFIFFVSHKKIYITNDDSFIFLTGEATKNKSGFKEEFFYHVDELKKDED